MLLLIQINQTCNGAYQILVDATTVIYFIPCCTCMRRRSNWLIARIGDNAQAVLIPGGKFGRLAGGFVRILGGARRDCALVDSAGRGNEQMALRG